MRMPLTNRPLMLPPALLCLLLILIMAQEAGAQQREYLSGGEVGGVLGVSLGSAATGAFVKKVFMDCEPHWKKPLGIDMWFTRRLGGQPRPTRMNFMDSNRASFISTVLAGLTIAGLDAAYPKGEASKDFWQNQFLYYSGAVTQKGLQDVVKGAVGRQRPMAHLHPQIAHGHEVYDRSHYRLSFYSGHSASAFYSMTFLNKRVRDAMRTQMTPGEYDTWSWVSPLLTYAWATFVAGSRIHAYQHYFTDVLAGAIAGWLVAELFYGLADDLTEGERVDNSESTLLRLSFRF